MKNSQRISQLLCFLFFVQLLPAQNVIQIPYTSSPLIDGFLSPGEWDASDTVTISLSGNRQVKVLFMHDSLHLYVAYLGNLASANVRFPEINVDVNYDRSLAWQADDWWFHVSATDCESQGKAGNYDNCQLVRPNWTGMPNFVNGGPAVDTVEIQIPFSTIQLDIQTVDTIGLSFNVSNTFNAWEYWPSGAEVNLPASWGKAVFESNPSTGISEDFDHASLHFFPNPSNGEIFLSLPADIGEREFGVKIYDLGGKLLHQENIILISNSYNYSLKDDLGAGLYYMVLKGKENSFSGKIILR